MNKRVKQRISRVISPIVIGGLKVHTAITGQERSRVLIRNEYGEILLVHGFVGAEWTLPGGGIERGESPAQAALREVHEETGITITPKQLRHITTLDKSESPKSYTAHLFVATIHKNELPSSMANPRELIDIAWVLPSALPARCSVLVRHTLKLLSQ